MSTKQRSAFTHDVLPLQERTTAKKVRSKAKKGDTLNWDAIIAEERKKSASKAGKAEASSKTSKSAKSEKSSDATDKKTHQFSQFMKPAKRVKSKSEKAQSSTFEAERGSASKKASPPSKPLRTSKRPDEVVAQEGTRINKLIANFSTYSRRQADALIEAGKVTLNGKKVTELGLLIEKPQSVRIEVNGELIKTQQRIRTVVMNKPKDCITTRSDERGRRTIYDVLPEDLKGLKPIGRLDRNSTGLLLLTNDGDMVNLLTHPKYHLTKVYRVELDRAVENPERLAQRFLEGLSLEGEKQLAQAVEVFMVKPTIWGVSLNSGMYRQVRRMFEACGYDVVALKRIAIGAFQLSGLKPGEHRELRYNDVQSLKNGAMAAFKQSEKDKRDAARIAKLAEKAKKSGAPSIEDQVTSYLKDLDPSVWMGA